jgi:hypothetical protein
VTQGALTGSVRYRTSLGGAQPGGADERAPVPDDQPVAAEGAAGVLARRRDPRLCGEQRAAWVRLDR